MIEAQQEEEESDSFMTYYLGIFYRDDYRKKSVALYSMSLCEDSRTKES